MIRLEALGFPEQPAHGLGDLREALPALEQAVFGLRHETPPAQRGEAGPGNVLLKVEVADVEEAHAVPGHTPREGKAPKRGPRVPVAFRPRALLDACALDPLGSEACPGTKVRG